MMWVRYAAVAAVVFWISTKFRLMKAYKGEVPLEGMYMGYNASLLATTRRSIAWWSGLAVILAFGRWPSIVTWLLILVVAFELLDLYPRSRGRAPFEHLAEGETFASSRRSELRFNLARVLVAAALASASAVWLGAR
jgi:hypothetical protein